MARLSAENSEEQLAVINTPKQKGGKSRFKEFFKSGNSRSSLTSSMGSSPPSSPSMSSPSGVENLKPGFQKVGVHPAERASSPPISPSIPSSSGFEHPKPGFKKVGVRSTQRAHLMDLEEWEKIKEENQHLSHADKIRLYNDQEDLKRHGTSGSDEEMLTPFGVGTPEMQKGSKAHEVLGIPSDTTEIEPAIASDMSAVQEPEEFEGNTISEWVADPRGQDPDVEKAESLRKAYEDSNSSSASSDHEGIKEPAQYVPEPGDVTPAIQSATKDFYSTRLYNPLLQDDRTSAYLDQSDNNDAISNIGEPRNADAVRAIPFVSLDQQVTDAMDQDKALSPHPEPDTVHDTEHVVPTGIMQRIHAKMLAETEKLATLVPQVEFYKVGPWEIETGFAMVLITIPSVLYAMVLLIKAIEGPYQLGLLIWRLVVISVAYKGVSTLLGWAEDGSRDVLLVPAEEAYALAKTHVADLAAVFLDHLVQAMVVALKEMDSDDEI